MRRAALENLAVLQDPVVDAVSDALRCRDKGIRLRAAREVFDRTGVRPDAVSGDDVRRVMDALIAMVVRHVPSDALPLLRSEIRKMSARYRGLVTDTALPAGEPEPEEMVL